MFDEKKPTSKISSYSPFKQTLLVSGLTIFCHSTLSTTEPMMLLHCKIRDKKENLCHWYLICNFWASSPVHIACTRGRFQGPIPALIKKTYAAVPILSHGSSSKSHRSRSLFSLILKIHMWAMSLFHKWGGTFRPLVTCVLNLFL